MLQDAAAANRRRCVRNALTNVAEQEHEDGNHARMSVLYARAMLAYHYTLAAIGKHMHNLQDGEQSTDSDLDEAGEIGPGTNFVEFISKSAGAERLRKF